MYEFLQETVGDNMTRAVRSVAPETTVGDLYRLFAADGFDAYPVVRDDILVGMVSKLDALKVFALGQDQILPHLTDGMAGTADAIMSSEIIAVDPETKLQRVLELMVRHRVKSLPVVSQGRNLLGIIAREDVMRAMERSTLLAISSSRPLRAGVMSTFGLERIFAPRRVAIVGGSPRRPRSGPSILRNMTSGGFAGEIALVNPRYREIDGRKRIRISRRCPLSRISSSSPRRRCDSENHRSGGRAGRRWRHHRLVRTWTRRGLARGSGREDGACPQDADCRAELPRRDVPRHCVECELRRASGRAGVAGPDFAIRRDRGRDGRLGRGTIGRIFGDRFDRRPARCRCRRSARLFRTR